MTDTQLATNSPSPALQSELIDRVCDEFERAVRNGGQPRIEDVLGSYPNLDREALLQELIALEIELLGTRDETATFDVRQQQFSIEQYYQRFPEATPLLDGLQKERDSRQAAASDLSCAPVGPDVSGISAGQTAEPRRRIKQFELQSVLGRGGFGVVWQAVDKRLQRDVAIKVPRPDRLAPSDRALFIREARAAAKLRHPNIIAIYEVGEFDSEIFIVSELVEGVSLQAWLQSQQMLPPAAALLIAKLANAAHHAHEQGIVHRDLKPANVLLDRQGEPHVADFGLAKRETGEESVSVAGQIIGTPAYMAPEQARGEHNAIDRRTDVYALGAIFYELLTNRRPFAGELSVLLQQIQHTQPPGPRSINPGVPKDLEAICLKCLAKNPAKRYDTAQALAEDIHLYLAGETLRGIPAPLPNRMGKWLLRHRRFVAAIGMTFLVALSIAGGFAWQIRGTKPIPPNLREVKFVTEPPGCEITVVSIDPKTIEPDPTKIEHAKGRTPLSMNIEPGEYLVLAVLDVTRFHEVMRYVPLLTENGSVQHRHTRSTLDADGRVELATIEIPLAGVTKTMALIEKSDRLVDPKSYPGGVPRAWALPSFFVDLKEISVQDIENRGVEVYGAEGWEKVKRDSARIPGQAYLHNGFGPGPISLLPHPVALSYLELQGKRLPSAAELYYLTTVVCGCPPTVGTDVAAGPCILPDGRVIEGIPHGNPEWTSTSPGGAFSGFPNPANATIRDFLLRMVGGGDTLSRERISPTGLSTMITVSMSTVGARGIRSVRPRREAKDFMTPVADSAL